MSNIFKVYETRRATVDKEFLDEVYKATLLFLEKKGAKAARPNYSRRIGSRFDRFDEEDTIIVSFFVGTEATAAEVEDVMIKNDEELGYVGVEVVHNYDPPSGNYRVYITMTAEIYLYLLDEYEETL